MGDSSAQELVGSLALARGPVNRHRWVAGSGLPATASLLLYRWALDRPERAEHAAIARFGAQQYLAVGALVEELAGIDGHGLALGKSALRARENGLVNNTVHGSGRSDHSN